MMDRAEIKKIVEKARAKADAAYRNYQDSGTNRYYTSYAKNEELADALEGFLNAEKSIRIERRLSASVKMWASTIAEMPYYSQDRKEKEITKILNQIEEDAIYIDAERNSAVSD